MPSSGVQTCADRKSTRLNSSHGSISYAVFCLTKKKKKEMHTETCTDPTPVDMHIHQRLRQSDALFVPQPQPFRSARALFFFVFFFFFNDTATTEIYTLSLHDALPISFRGAPAAVHRCAARAWRG